MELREAIERVDRCRRISFEGVSEEGLLILEAARLELARREQEPKKVTIAEMVEAVNRVAARGIVSPSSDEQALEAAAALLRKVVEFKQFILDGQGPESGHPERARRAYYFCKELP